MNITWYSDNIVMNMSMGISIVLFGFLLFLLFTFVASLFVRKGAEGSKKLSYPRLSILIPAYNEEDNIVGCLESILTSDYDLEKVEVIVIDDKSTDRTATLVNEFIRDYAQKKDHGGGLGLHIRLIQGKHQGKSKSLNRGVKAATHEMIMTIDADVVLEKGTIKKLVAPMLADGVAATNAVAVIRNPCTLLDYFQMIEFCLNNLIRVSFSRVFSNSIWFFGAVACYKKSVLKQVGYFKTDTLTEDMDICLEMYNKSYTIVTVPDAMISTVACSSLQELFRQRMRWYYGALQSLFKNRQLLRSDRRSAPILFLFFNQYWWTFFSFVFFPMTAYQVYFWMPTGGAIEVASYLFRWFSFSGPLYVLYMMPVWGLNFLNIFGVSAGIITFLMSLCALYMFKGRLEWKTFVCLFFYFPYTIIQDAIIVSGVVMYLFLRRKAYFID